MPHAPKVSIVVPVFNMGRFLPRGIDSFLNQSERDIEVIVCDNNSDDDTSRIVSSYADPRVKYFRNDSNIGMINNFNTGLKLARGKYVSIISCDEFMLGNDSLKMRLDLLESQRGIDLVWCNYDLETTAGEIVSFPMRWPKRDVLSASEGIQAVFEDALCTNFRITTVIFRRQLIEVTNYSIPLCHSGDRPIILSWILHSRNIACIKDVLHRSYMHTEHRHDLHGRRAPWLGERDFLMLRFLDDQYTNMVTMGLPINRLEFLALRQLFFVLLRTPRESGSFVNFYNYGLIFVCRSTGLLLRAALSPVFGATYYLLKVLSVSWLKTRSRLGKVPVIRKLYRALFS